MADMEQRQSEAVPNPEDNSQAVGCAADEEDCKPPPMKEKKKKINVPLEWIEPQES
jgi:hypothetical protein